jgi:cation:H+ antiporter
VQTWLLFLGCAAVILVAGTRLSRHADVLAEKTGLGRTWIGIVLLSTVTSLPELATGASSVLLHDLPDIAAGDVIGSCMVNILLLTFLDFGHRQPLSSRVHQGHVLSAGFGILLIGLATMALMAGPRAPAVGWIGLPSLLLLGLYLLAMRAVFVHERSRMAAIAAGRDGADALMYEELSKVRSMLRFGAYAIALIAAAAYLPALGDEIAAMTGLGHTFVGTLFIAISTSLPELVVSAAALRLGAADMAVGNLFGSNLFNIAVLGIDDLLYTRGPLFAAVSGTHALSAVAAMTMTAAAVLGLTYRARVKGFYASWDALGIAAIYLFAISALYMMR